MCQQRAGADRAASTRVSYEAFGWVDLRRRTPAECRSVFPREAGRPNPDQGCTAAARLDRPADLFGGRPQLLGLSSEDARQATTNTRSDTSADPDDRACPRISCGIRASRQWVASPA